MIDSRSGIIMEDIGNLQNSLVKGLDELVNKEKEKPLSRPFFK